MVDTDKLSPGVVVKLVTEAHEALVVSKKKPLGLRSTRVIDVDPILAETVLRVLECNGSH